MARAERKKPKKKKAAEQEAEAPSQDSIPESRGAREHKLRVLVIDDDHIDRMTVCRALEKSKLDTEVEEVDCLRAALSAITTKAYDVLILDHLLPDGKSLDFLRDLRSRGIRMPIVVTTGYGDEMLVVDLLKTGASDYLSKDKINEEAIFRAVSHAIRVFKAEEERTRKDSLLEAGTEAATLLQTQMDRVTVISSALGILGKAMDADRLVVFEQHPHPETKEPVISHEYEWVRTSDSIKLKDPRQANMMFETLGISRWIGILAKGHPVGGPLQSFPGEEREHLEKQGIRSLLAVPIMLESRMWGFIQIEAHDKERQWTDQEKSILLSLSTGIGSALLHRRADEALRRSEAFYRAIVDQQAELICRFTPDCRLTFVNETFSSYYGKSRDELIDADLMEFVEPDSREDLRRHIDSLGPKSPAGTIEHCVLKPGGELRWMQCTCLAIFDGHDNVIEFQSVGRDITALKNTEGALEASRDYLNKIINSIADPIFVKDSAHRMVLVNDAECKLTGHPREKVLGKTDHDFFPSEQVEVFWEKDAEVLRTGEENINEETITDASGVTHTIITKKTRYEDASGENYIVGIIRDISELKEAERALRESEEKYRTLVMNLDVGVSRTTADRNGRFLQANPAHAHMLGYDSCDELMNVRVVDLYEYPEDRAKIAEELKTCGVIHDREIQMKKEDGTTIIVALTARARVDAHGNIDWIDSVLEDITERKRADEMLRASEARFREFAEMMPQTVFDLDTDSNITFVNRAAYDEWGFTPEDLKNGLKSFDIMAPEERDRLVENTRRRFEGDKSAHEYVAQRKDGSRFPVVLYSSPIFADGKPAGIRGIAINVEEQKKAEQDLRESEENFRAVAENAIDGILIANKNGVHEYANKRASEITGYSIEELLKIGIMDLALPDEAPRILAQAKNRIEGYPVTPRYEAIVVRKDGENIPLEVSATRTVWKGKPAVMAIIRDITERKMIEEERAAFSATLLDVQEKERAEISAMLHDHLGQLLTLSRLELGSIMAVDSQSKQSVQNALERLDEALASVRRLAVTLRPPILDDLGIDNALESLTEEFTDSSEFEASFTSKGSIPSLTKEQETCLYRVLQEALTNVAKHSKATEVDVQLETTETETRLSVRDNGQGFNPDETQPRGRIGFVGMRERLLRCGGKLEVYSEKGKGTTVLACLPLSAQKG